MSCEYCKLIDRYDNGYKSGEAMEAEIGDFGIAVNPEGRIFINYLCEDECDHCYIDDSFDIKFCPVCGSPLSDPTPLTLEQLRGTEGEPVWVERINIDPNDEWDIRCSGWHLICGEPGVERAQSSSGKYTQSFHFEEYGKTWLAYTHKPKDREG